MKRRKRTPVLETSARIFIDYERLAEAIVRAEAKAKEDSDNVDSIKRESNVGQISSLPFAIVIGFTFRILAIIGFCFSLLVGVGGNIWIGIHYSWTLGSMLHGVLEMFVLLAVAFVIFVFAILMWAAANDIKNDKDKNYVVTVFSGIISTAALIIAVVAMIKSWK